jgi:hypothetical protein
MRRGEPHLNTVNRSPDAQNENWLFSIARNRATKTLYSLLSIDCRFPKLDVAGSTPVSRSNFSTTCTNPFHSVLRLCSDYITWRLFSNWLTASSRLSTGDCV